MDVRLTQSAFEDPELLPIKVCQRIVDKLEHIAGHSNPLSLGKPLAGHHGYWRFRAGEYRVVAQLAGNTLMVHLIAKRDSIYKGL